MSDPRPDDQLTTVDPVSSPSQNYLVVRQLTRMPSLFARGLIYLILLLIALGIAFASIVEIDVFVGGYAIIESDANPIMMYPESAGYVREIYVRKWQSVETGTPLYLLETESDEEGEVRRELVKAKSTGSITSVLVNTIGQWVEPTTPLCVTLPEPSNFIARITIENEDIAKIEKAMPVTYKIDAFPYSEFGILEGRVENISPTTMLADSGSIAYQVVGTLDQLFYQVGKKRYPLREGMVGTAEFNTGKRTMISIMFKTSKSALKGAKDEN